MKKFVACTVLAFSFAAVAASAETLTGTVSDAMCAGDTAKASKPDHEACAKKCIKGGEKPVLIVGDKVYTITNPDTLTAHAGHHVTVDGSVAGSALTVKSVKM
ncbi:MAG: hypothetical protein M3O02_06985 [Acidobacteriota bacterium]|nr:hypothetical protein [Acidobacteriota bacterium]